MMDYSYRSPTSKLVARLRLATSGNSGMNVNILLAEAAADLEAWESRWNSLRWCAQGCGDNKSTGGPSIGGGGGFF